MTDEEKYKIERIAQSLDIVVGMLVTSAKGGTGRRAMETVAHASFLLNELVNKSDK